MTVSRVWNDSEWKAATRPVPGTLGEKRLIKSPVAPSNTLTTGSAPGPVAAITSS